MKKVILIERKLGTTSPMEDGAHHYLLLLKLKRRDLFLFHKNPKILIKKKKEKSGVKILKM